MNSLPSLSKRTESTSTKASSASANAPVNFRDTFQRAQAIVPPTVAHEMTMGLPRMERGVNQTALVSRRLAEKVSRSGDSDTTKAHFLLATRGFDADHHTRMMHQIDLQTTIEASEPRKDIQGYLRHVHRMLILTAIQEAKKNTIEDVNRSFVKSIESDWESDKRNIFEALGRRFDVDASMHAANDTTMMDTTMSRSQTQQHNTTIGSRGLSSRQLKYARVVFELNDALLDSQPAPLLHWMLDVAATVEDVERQAKAEIIGCWSLLTRMVGETDVRNRQFQRRVLQPSEFKDAYSRGDAQLRANHVAGALDFLHEQYIEHIKGTIEQDPRDAGRLGGAPSLLAHIKAFLRVKYARVPLPEHTEGFLNGLSFWAIVFYALRCGDSELALRVCEDGRDAMAHEDHKFVEFLSEYVRSESRSLSRKSCELLESMAGNKKQSDPFRLAVMNIIGRFDVKNVSWSVFETMEDFLWLKLSFVREDGSYTLTDLQQWLSGPEVGAAYFSRPGVSVFLYFRALLLTAQFERAIEYLWTSVAYRCEATHFGVALHHYGLLHVAKNAHSDLLTLPATDRTAHCDLNIARLLIQYARSFSSTDPRQALEYFHLLKSVSTDNSNAFILSIRDLVLETNEVQLILGSLNADGSRKPGCVDRFVKTREELSDVIDTVAQSCEENGRVEDAIVLYDLAENYSSVLTLLNTQLGQCVAVPSSSSPLRASIHTLALRIDHRFHSLNVFHLRPLAELYASFSTLLKLFMFFDSYHSSAYEEALSFSESIALLPTSSAQVTAKVDQFRTVADDIRRNIGAILTSTMNCVYQLHERTRTQQQHRHTQQLQQQQHHHPVADTLLDRLRAQADALTTFAGMISYRVSAEVNSRLMRYNVLMNNVY